MKPRLDNINDLLKTMVVRISTAGEPRGWPTARRPDYEDLGSFTIDLTANPTLAKLREEIRGERVESKRPTSSAASSSA